MSFQQCGTSSPLLRVEGLHVGYPLETGVHEALCGVDLTVRPGEIVGLVGESGSGKTTLLQTLTRLLPEGVVISARTFQFRNASLLEMTEARMRKIRGAGMAMIFQNPKESLNPIRSVGDQIAEGGRLHQGLGRRAARTLVLELLARVGLQDPIRMARAFPHELSGGMCQRVMIAMALACKPFLLLADEPTTALDVRTQSEILKILKTLVRDPGMGMVYVTHDLRVIADVAHRVLVLHEGRLVEEGHVQAVLETPLHPYTRCLLSAMPRLGARKGPVAISRRIAGRPHVRDSSGCGFVTRCDRATDRCALVKPILQDHGQQRRVACHRCGEAYMKNDVGGHPGALRKERTGK